MDFLLRQRMTQLRSADAAVEVRQELLAAINDNRAHNLDAHTISVSKHAVPHGAHPTHRTLLTCFGL